MAVVSITRLRVRSWFYLPAFFLRTVRIARQATRAEGNLRVGLLRDRRRTFWTATSWSSEVTMRAFVLADPHKSTMRKLLNWCNEASLVHWTQPSGALPSWEEAHRRLEQEGRASKVNYPSTAHAAHAFPAPTARRTTDLRIK